ATISDCQGSGLRAFVLHVIITKNNLGLWRFVMPRKTAKTAVVAFKVEKELARFLNQLPNKSAFIRKAIAAQMNIACPLCHGTGQVTRWVHDHFVPLMSSLSARTCEGCGNNLSIPDDPGNLSEEDQAR